MLCDRIFHGASLTLYILNLISLFASACLLPHFYQRLSILIAIAAASFSANFLSAKWTFPARQKSSGVGWILIHCVQLALPWRYLELVRSWDEPRCDGRLATVEVCLLRVLYSAVGSLPTVCLHLHAVLDQEMSISAAAVHRAFIVINLVDLSWAVASVSRKSSRVHPDRMVLSWPGVVAQTLWRLGTISSRLVVLVAFTVSYESLIVAVVLLQWFVMVLAHLLLFGPDDDDEHSASRSRLRRLLVTCAVSFVYIIDYFTFSTQHNKAKMIVYYVVRFIENCFLLGLWYQSVMWHHSGVQVPVTVIVVGGYCVGIISLLLYQSCFSLSRLRPEVPMSAENGFVCRLPFPIRRKLPSKFDARNSSQTSNSFVKVCVSNGKLSELETRF